MKSVTLLCPQTTDTQRAFCRKSQSFGLGQTNLAEVWMAFGVFPTKLEHPSWHCELLIHGPFIQKFFQANKRPHINFYFIKIPANTNFLNFEEVIFGFREKSYPSNMIWP